MARDYLALYSEVLRRGAMNAVVLNTWTAEQRDAA
jgi:hypothetical protein